MLKIRNRERFNMPAFVRPIAAAILALASLSLAAPAAAQLELQDDYLIGEGSVDLYRGNLMLSAVDLSIGEQGAGHLVLKRQHGVDVKGSPFGSATAHNHNIWVLAPKSISAMVTNIHVPELVSVANLHCRSRHRAGKHQLPLRGLRYTVWQ